MADFIAGSRSSSVARFRASKAAFRSLARCSAVRTNQVPRTGSPLSMSLTGLT